MYHQLSMNKKPGDNKGENGETVTSGEVLYKVGSPPHEMQPMHLQLQQLSAPSSYQNYQERVGHRARTRVSHPGPVGQCSNQSHNELPRPFLVVERPSHGDQMVVHFCK